jgi:hypothetical protein
MPSDTEQEAAGGGFNTPTAPIAQDKDLEATGAALPEPSDPVPVGTGLTPQGIDGLSTSLLAVVQQMQLQAAQQQEQFAALQRQQQEILSRLAPATSSSTSESELVYLNPLDYLAEIGVGFPITPGRAAPLKPHLFNLYNDRTADTLEARGRKTALEEYRLLYATTFYFTASLRALETTLEP